MHPVFGTKEYIPGLNMCPPLFVQMEDFKPVENIDVRLSKEFQVGLSLKKTPPTTVNIGFDRKHNEKVALVSYKTGSFPDVGDLVKETSILRNLNDPNILMYHGTVFGESINKMYLSFEPFDYFLSQLLCEDQQLFEPSVIKCVMTQLLSGLKYLHAKDIVHRDISPKNLVITEKGSLKISNFKSSQTTKEHSKPILTTEICYQPVNVLLESETVSTADDMWSATCIFAELLLKTKLFPSTGKGELLQDIFSILGYPDEHIWPDFVKLPAYKCLDVPKFHKFDFLVKYFNDIQCLGLLRDGFMYDPKYRMCAAEFSEHPYFTEEPTSITQKCFGGMLHGKSYKFPVK